MKHEISVVCTWMTEDDKGVHAECACGWRSHDVRANAHARRLGDEHIRVSERIRRLRESGLSKRQAKREVYGRVSQHRPTSAPVAEYRRKARAKRAQTFTSNSHPNA